MNKKTRTASTTMKRSDELVLIGYFLSRCTDFSDDKKPRPPAALRVARWSECYDLFFERFADGRDGDCFRHTLRNTRDKFDPLFNNGRIGWLDAKKRRPVLSERDELLHRYWESKTDHVLTAHILEQLLGFGRL